MNPESAAPGSSCTPTVRHDRNAHQFVVDVDGHRCELDYGLADGVMSITHTGVPAAVGGRGIAGQLVAAAFASARADGLKVRPLCSYAAGYARKHPELADLLAP
jgi:uncharacterized protein